MHDMMPQPQAHPARSRPPRPSGSKLLLKTYAEDQEEAARGSHPAGTWRLGTFSRLTSMIFKYYLNMRSGKCRLYVVPETFLCFFLLSSSNSALHSTPWTSSGCKGSPGSSWYSSWSFSSVAVSCWVSATNGLKSSGWPWASCHTSSSTAYMHAQKIHDFWPALIPHLISGAGLLWWHWLWRLLWGILATQLILWAIISNLGLPSLNCDNHFWLRRWTCKHLIVQCHMLPFYVSCRPNAPPEPLLEEVPPGQSWVSAGWFTINILRTWLLRRS